MLGVAHMIVLGQHLACDLSVARFVGSDEAKLIAAEVRGEAIEEQEEPDADQNKKLVRRGEGRVSPKLCQQAMQQRGLRDRDGLWDGRGLDRFGHRDVGGGFRVADGSGLG